MATDENKPKPEMTKCPECNVPVRVDRIEKHLTKVHRVKELLPKHRKNLIKPPATPKSFIVDEFGVLQSYDTWWKNQNLAENFSSARPAQSGETSREFNIEIIPPKRQLFHCPECGVTLLKKNLNRHLRKVHHK